LDTNALSCHQNDVDDTRDAPMRQPW